MLEIVLIMGAYVIMALSPILFIVFIYMVIEDIYDVFFR